MDSNWIAGHNRRASTRFNISMVSRTQRIESWGRLTKDPHQVSYPAFLDQACNDLRTPGPPTLPFGCGRSYGDVCLNSGGRLIATKFLDHIIEVDWAQGVIRAEAGLTIDALLRLSVPRGWFLPVCPGTKHVSLGGAVANDVHGKNHESAGTFGCHVRRIGLYRSSGELLELSASQNADLFGATVGGLGLTGLIAWVELSLVPITSSYFEVETLHMTDLDAFFDLAANSREWPYTVAWVDCSAGKERIGRGLFIRGRHAERGGYAVHRGQRWSVPFDITLNLMNPLVMTAFNFVYRHRPMTLGRRNVHYDGFLFPLDALGHGNRLYGRRGFFQHQCVVPMASARTTMQRLLAMAAKFHNGATLAALKLFGDRPSLGVLSFPQPGATLAIEFSNNGPDTAGALAQMADIVLGAGGRLYPAKDAAMSGEMFRAGYPNWRKVETHRDPAVLSNFWRRVLGDKD